MSNLATEKRTRSLFENPYLLATGGYLLAWALTYTALRLKWAPQLGLLNPFLLAADFILPLVLILVFIIFTRKSSRPFRWFGIFYVILFAGVIVNLFWFKFQLMNYGDVGTLSGMIAHHEIFPRWMLGTGILDFVISHVPFPFFGPGDDLLLIKFLSALVMCFSAALLMFFFPNRLSVALTLTSPVWLLFSSGYDEYYPFIAPLFLIFLLVISAKMDRRFSAVFVGIFAAVVVTTYAGFIPLGLILLFVYMIWRGFKKGLLASLICLISCLLLIILFNGADLLAFWQKFQLTLNLYAPESFPGQAMLGTPFFKPVFAFGKDNFNRMFLEFFWTGSFPYLFMVIGGFIFLAGKRESGDSKKSMLFMGLFLIYQLLYFIFMIPRLGIVEDIDLFFTLYLSLAFTAGWLLDRISVGITESKRRLIQLTSFSFCAGSTAMVTLYLVFLGLYALV